MKLGKAIAILKIPVNLRLVERSDKSRGKAQRRRWAKYGKALDKIFAPSRVIFR
jgi:hypothetical protein